MLQKIYQIFHFVRNADCIWICDARIYTRKQSKAAFGCAADYSVYYTFELFV